MSFQCFHWRKFHSVRMLASVQCFLEIANHAPQCRHVQPMTPYCQQNTYTTWVDVERKRSPTTYAQVITPTACGALFSARATPQPSQNLAEPWWNPRGTLPQGRPRPPRSLSKLRPQSFQLLGKKREKTLRCDCRCLKELLSSNNMTPMLVDSERKSSPTTR